MFDSTRSSRVSHWSNPCRIVGLLACLTALSYVVVTMQLYYQPNQIAQYFVENRKCEPGVFRGLTQLEHTRWSPPEEPGLALPLYVTQSLDVFDRLIEHAVIVQHGNLRDANNYFCGAVNSLLETNRSLDFLRSHLIVAPQFLIDGDLCWETNGQFRTVSTATNATCGYPVWTSEGWKDGHAPVTAWTLRTSSPSPSLLPSSSSSSRRPLFSYDIFNLLIDQLANKTVFPNLRVITIFGFSAGGQTVLRYSMWPDLRHNHTVGRISDRIAHNATTQVQFVVGDVSSYLYFDARRPLPDAIGRGFEVPSANWLAHTPWAVDAHGQPWITNWAANCSAFNQWRFGLERLRGYYDYHARRSPNFTADLIGAFPGRDLHFLVGLNDSANCKLSAAPTCVDNELATYCPAMLQGSDRLDRFLKWKSYLETFFGLAQGVAATLVPDMTHDAVAMLRSSAAHCIVFKHCTGGGGEGADFVMGPPRLRWDAR